MNLKKAKDFWIWLFWLVVTIGTVLMAIHYYRYTNGNSNNYDNYSDKTGITSLIIVLFFMALIKNCLNTITIFTEFGKIERSEGLFYEHAENLQNAAKGKLSISQDFSLTIIENRLLRQESWVQLFSTLLITLGMIGTVVGLTLSMQGLSQAMDSIKIATSESHPNNITDGLGQALSGMSSSFITTLAGSVLGGFFLKLLSHSTTNLIEELIDQIRYKAEVKTIPDLQNKIWQNDVNTLSEAYQNMTKFIKSSDQIDSSLRRYNQNMSEASKNLNAIASNLNREIFSLQLNSQADTQKRIEELLYKLIKGIDIFRKAINMAVFFLAIFLILAVIFLFK